MAVVGGAKVSTKLELLGNLVRKVEHLVIGGGIMLLAGAAMLYVEWRIHPEALGDLVHSGSAP